MAMLCIIYVIAVGTLLGIAGLLVERVLPTASQRRWVWCAVIPMSIVLPGLYRARHTWSVTQAFEGHTVSPMLAPLGPASWARMDSYYANIDWLWMSASLMILVWSLANAWRVSRVVSLSRRQRAEASRSAVIDGIPVVVTDRLGPATAGIFRSRVLVPRWVLGLPEAQRQYVVRHEEEHRRAHDARLIFLMSLPILLMPWNLAMWWQLRRLRLAVEMDCDNRVVGALGNASAYGELLFKVAQAADRGPRLQPALLGVGMLERRLTFLLAPTPLRRFQQIMLPAAGLTLLIIVLLMPHPVLGTTHAHAAVTPVHTTRK